MSIQRNLFCAALIAAFSVTSTAETITTLPPEIAANHDWQAPAKADPQLASALETLQHGYPQRAIRVGYLGEADFFCSGEREQFLSSFLGLVEATAYYYFWTALADEYRYFDRGDKPADYFLKRLPPALLKQYADAAIQTMTDMQRKNLLAFARDLASHYQTFFDHINPDNVQTALAAQDRPLGDDFYLQFDIPAPRDDSCYVYSELESPAIKSDRPEVPDLEDTYFSYSNSLDRYLYGFWYRRFYHGTAEQTKALLNYVIQRLENAS